MAQPASACSAAAVYPAAPSKVIDLTPHLQRRRRNRRQAVLHMILALWTQYLSLGCLLLYALLRVVLTGSIPLGQYSGPLAVLWPISYFLLLASYSFDKLLWREEWAAPPQR